jgi:hypothetical protein
VGGTTSDEHGFTHVISILASWRDMAPIRSLTKREYYTDVLAGHPHHEGRSLPRRPGGLGGEGWLRRL